MPVTSKERAAEERQQEYEDWKRKALAPKIAATLNKRVTTNNKTPGKGCSWQPGLKCQWKKESLKLWCSIFECVGKRFVESGYRLSAGVNTGK
jgi:hypothetical protein